MEDGTGVRAREKEEEAGSRAAGAVVEAREVEEAGAVAEDRVQEEVRAGEWAEARAVVWAWEEAGDGNRSLRNGRVLTTLAGLVAREEEKAGANNLFPFTKRGADGAAKAIKAFVIERMKFYAVHEDVELHHGSAPVLKGKKLSAKPVFHFCPSSPCAALCFPVSHNQSGSGNLFQCLHF